ncbi:hypothetical protein ACS0TY_016843 [Phlomoides rotata]
MRFSKSVRTTRKGGAAPFSFIRRRLRTSGSVKGGKSSAFFSITGKKRGGGFDNHEPSSPKVTCIGQVRVKSKKRVKQCRRRIGEVSFRTAEQSHGGGGGGQLIEDKDKVWIRSQRLSSSSVHSHREQRWVHLPISVCEALRAFRDEICCFLPCGCSCFSREREKDTERDHYGGENGCGAVLARWLGAADGGEDEKRREIEVVVGDEEGAEVMSIRSSRRHVFEDIVVNEEEEEEEEARVSICIPPKNALLLMRCRSDPMKMSSLAHRFSLDIPKVDTQEIEEDENDAIEVVNLEDQEGKDEISVASESNLEMEVGENDCEEEENGQEIEENDPELMEKVTESDISTFGGVSEQENTQNVSESGEKMEREKEEETEELERETTAQPDEEEKPVQSIDLQRENPTIINQSIIKENKSSSLPECLLLMMCEPKLSMEVSKETWVRGTDFIRLLPERPRKPAKTAAGEHELVKRRPSVDSKSKPRVPAPPSKKNEQLPARSSCSLPAASMAAVIERNQVSARKCEPFALTRCKSEPMSTAAAKLMPEPC